MSWVLPAVSVLSITVMIAAMFITYSRMLPASSPVIVSVLCVAIGVAVWLVIAAIVHPSLPVELLAPIAALGGLGTFLAAVVVRSTGTSAVASVLFAIGWSVLVFAPAAIVSFTGVGPFGVRPIDQGGSLAINVATGASALGVLIAAGSSAPRLKPSVVPRGVATAGVIALTVGWVGWLVGAELAIDDLTPGILVNGVVAAAGGVVGWLIVQRIKHQSTTLGAVAAGIMSGLVGVSAGAPMYAWPAAFIAGGIAAAAACLFTLHFVRTTRRQQWFIVGSHLIAGAVGLVVLGLLANDLGFLFTGQYVFLRDQVICSVLVAAWGFAASIGLWWATRGIRRDA